VTLSRHEIRMPLAAPGANGAELAFTGPDLRGIGMLPAPIVSGLPAMMRHDEDLDVLLSDGRDDGLQVVDQTDLLRDLLDPGPQFTAFGEEVVIGIDEQQAGPNG